MTPRHSSSAPGVAAVQRVAADLARRKGLPDDAPGWMDDLLLTRCHELLAALAELRPYVVCTAAPHAVWCPKAEVSA